VYYIVEKDGYPVGSIVDQLIPTENGYLCTSHTVWYVDVYWTYLFTYRGLVMELHHDFAIIRAAKTEIIDYLYSEYLCEIDYTQPQPVMTVFIDPWDENPTPTYVYQLESGDKVFHPDLYSLYIAAKDGLYPQAAYSGLFLNTKEFTLIPGNLIVHDEQSIDFEEYSISGFNVSFIEDDTFITMNSIVDQEGNLYYVTTPEQPGLVVRRVTEAEVLAAEEQMPGAGYIISPMAIPYSANIAVARPQHSIHSIIDISGIDPTYVQLEDNRQHIIDHRQKHDQWHFTVEIRKDYQQHLGKYSLPIICEELALYSNKDMYIDPTLPEVQELVQSILAGEQDAWLAVNKLVNWVYDYIKPIFISIPRPVKHILDEPLGTSYEYAILFASLARAAGIPTKIAEGFRYSNRHWVGHIWNEVWLGEWIAVDPTYRQVAPDALLVKILEGTDVSKITTHDAAILPDFALNIRLVDVLRKRQLPQLVTGIAGQTFTNADYAFSVTVPNNWSFTSVDNTSFIASANNNLAHVVVELNNVPKETTAQMILNSTLNMLVSTLEEYDEINLYLPEISDTIQIGGYEGASTGLGYEVGGVLFFQEIYVVVVEDLCYTIGLTAPAMFYADYSEDFAEIIDSIVIY